MSKLLTRKSKVRPTVIPGDYLDLVGRFPLRPLRSDAEYRAAGEIVDQYIGREDLTEGQRDYLSALIHFTEDYQQARRKWKFHRLTPLQLLKHLMEENDMTTTDLGYVLGSRGLASEVLNKKRGLSKALIAKLSKRFGIDQELFLNRPNVDA